MLIIFKAVIYAICYYITTTITPSDERRCEGEAKSVELKETVIIEESKEEESLLEAAEVSKEEEEEFVISDKNKE